MKNILYLSLISISLLNCKNNEVVNNSHSSIVINQHSKIDSIESMIELPFGSMLLINEKFPGIWDYPSISSSEIDNYESNKYNKLLNLISKECETSFNSLKKNNLTFLDLEKIKQLNIIGYDEKILKSVDDLDFNILGKLKELDNHTVFVSHSRNFRKKIEILDLLIFDKKTNELINGINIYGVFSGDMSSSMKLFYVDNNLNISVKKFLVYDDSSSSESINNYQINNLGEINSK